ncbi:MAG: response regulator [Gemmatimonadetes bacterium]|nr:response regulator [Gemmatimonadota bacterium]
MVVDDDPDARRAIAKVLSRNGMAVVQAENGLAAMAAIGLHPVVAVVCDVRMEFFNGFQVFDALKAERPDLAERLVFVTAWGDDPEVRAQLAQAGRPVVWKPFDMPVLVGLVRHMAEDRPDAPGSTARFSLEEARQIRERTLAPGGRPTCPCCNGELVLSHPFAGPENTGLVWELRCRRCFRTLTISGVPEQSMLPPEPPLAP